MTTTIADRGGAAPSRRTRILDAALDAFSERGYEATTIADVRERSGASVGSIYHHFGDKEGIAAMVYVDALRDYQSGVRAVLSRTPDAERAIRRLVAQHLEWVEANPNRAAFLLERREPEVAAASAAEVRALNHEVLAAVREWLRPHLEAGVIRRMPLELFYVIVLGPSQEYARHWLRDPDPRRITAARRVLSRAAWDAVRGDRKESR